MALVQTPDGRTVLVPDFLTPQVPQLDLSTLGPRGTGSTLPGDQAPPPPPPPPPEPILASPTGTGRKGGQTSRIGEAGGFVGQEIPNLPVTPTASVTGGALPSAMPQVAPAGAAPDLPAVVVPSLAAGVGDAKPGALAKANKAYDQQQAAQAAAQNRAPSIQDVMAAQREANADSLAAIDQATRTQQLEADAIYKARQAADVEADALRQQRAQWEQTRDRVIAQKTAFQDAARTEADNYKIDSSRYWRDASTGTQLLWGLGMVLSGIGEGLRGNTTNPVIQMLNQRIERDVKDQFAERDRLKDRAGNAEHDLDRYNAFSQNTDAQYHQRLGEVYTTLANQTIPSIAAQYGNREAQNRGAQLRAEFEQKATDNFAKAHDMAVTDDLHREQMQQERQRTALAWANYSQGVKRDQRDFDESTRRFNLDRQDRIDALQAQYSAAGDKALADQAAQQAKLGIGDPTTGASLLQPEAKPLLEQADAFEKAARSAPGSQAAALKLQADALRNRAEVQYGWKARNEAEAEKIDETVGSSQHLLNVITKIKRTLGDDPSSLDRQTWAALSSEFNQAKVAYIQAHGAKPSSREMEAISEVFGGDPDDFITRVGARSKLQAHLDAVQSGTMEETSTFLKQHRYRGDWRPQVPDAPAPELLNGKTSLEAAEAAEPGAAGKAYRAIATLGTGGDRGGIFDPQGRAEESYTTPTGLTNEDDAKVMALVKQWNAGNDKQRADVVTRLAQIASSPREALANAVIGRVRGEDPALFAQVLPLLPLERQQREAEMQKALQGTDAINLVTPWGNYARTSTGYKPVSGR